MQDDGPFEAEAPGERHRRIPQRRGAFRSAAMHLVQILLPLYDNDGQPIARERYAQVRRELTGRFGGLTAFTRAPAEGLWQENGKATVRDDIVVFEVMAAELDKAWWRRYRQELEARFRQEVVVIRAQSIRLL